MPLYRHHPDPKVDEKIQRVATLTRNMRRHQSAIDDAARERDSLVHELLHAGVPQSVLAARADVTTHALTKSLRRNGTLPAPSRPRYRSTPEPATPEPAR